MSRLTNIAHRSNSFNFALISSKPFVPALNSTYFDLRRVNTNKVLDCHKFVDLQISRLNLQIVKTAETVEAVNCYCAVERTADEYVGICQIEGKT